MNILTVLLKQVDTGLNNDTNQRLQRSGWLFEEKKKIPTNKVEFFQRKHGPIESWALALPAGIFFGVNLN